MVFINIHLNNNFGILFQHSQILELPKSVTIHWGSTSCIPSFHNVDINLASKSGENFILLTVKYQVPYKLFET